MRKNNQIAILAFMGFTMVQVSKATGIYPAGPLKAGSDTTIVKDSSNAIAVTDPKSEFTNLFSTAIEGDGVNGARLNPQAVSFVKEYIRKNEKGFLKMKEWGKPYLEMMDQVLEQHGLPKELKYLAVIESGLKYNANSWAGAVGPWAFMPAAAREYGLRMGHNDERLDYVKSTHAAARLLTDLYQRYGDWLLVIAAYNCGPGNVDKAISRNGGNKDFWSIQYNLPNESMNHVKKFIATHYIFEGEGGITTVTKNEMKNIVLGGGGSSLNEDELNSSVSKMITGRFNSSVILKYIEMEKGIFDHFNPGFDNKIAEEGKYELRLPVQKMNTFIQKRYEILDESVQTLLNGVTSSR